MKRVTVMMVLLLASVAQGSWLFDAGDTVSMADADVLTLPDSDWTVSGWVKLPGESAANRNLCEWTSANHLFRLFIGNSSTYPANRLRAAINGGTASVTSIIGSATIGNITDWQHIAVIRASNTVTMYVDGASNGTTSMLYHNAVNATGSWVWGDAAFDGRLGEWAKWDRAVDADELSALVAGGKPEDASGGAPAGRVDMFDGFDCQTGSLTVTNSNAEIDSGTHPLDRGDPSPQPVTMVWPKAATGYDTVNHQTYICWTKTPATTTLAQTFDVYCDTSNPPTTLIGNDLSVLYQTTGTLVDGTTYYCRVDATSVGGTTQGTVVSFTAEDPSGDIYYVGPAASGDGSGSDTSNLMAWSDVATETTTADTVRIIDTTGSSTIWSNYEGTYTEWPDRHYEAQVVTEYHISRTFQDYRRISRFMDGSYMVQGPVGIISYDPPRQTMDSSFVNGMMVDPSGEDQGLDGRGATFPANYDATLDHGDELPYFISTYPASIINEYAILKSDPLRSAVGANQAYCSLYGSVLTVVETALANNTWFRPSYRAYSGRSVEYQWSDVQTDRIPQIDLNCNLTLQAASADEARQTLGGWSSVERIVTRPMLWIGTGWTNGLYCVPFHNSSAYGGYLSQEESVAYLALYDSDLGTLTEDKRRLLIGCIQRGIDLAGVYLEGDNAGWWTGEGSVANGAYWPILFAGIVLDDEDLYDMGIDTHQDSDVSWTLTPRMDFAENMQPYQITATGETSWATPPWQINGISGVVDNTGTVQVVNGSTTVTGQAGDDWSGIVTVNDPDTDPDERHWFLTAAYADSVWTIADEGQASELDAKAYIIVGVDAVSSPPTITLDRAYEGTTNESATFIIADEMYCGNQYNDGKDKDYSEFDSSWAGKYWWTEAPANNCRYVGSVYGENAYQKIATSSTVGMVLAAVLMQREASFEAATKWNSPSTFGYYDWMHDSATELSLNYCDAWVGTTFTNEWTWPVSETGSKFILILK